jgi:GxxExxY protein
LNELTERIIGCAFKVSNALGCGFLEKVYENSLAMELRRSGLNVEQQASLTVRYEGEIVGEYCADLIVEGRVIVELKVVKALDNIHMARCLNCLRASGLRLCLLLNFGRTKVQVKRIVNGT